MSNRAESWLFLKFRPTRCRVEREAGCHLPILSWAALLFLISALCTPGIASPADKSPNSSASPLLSSAWAERITPKTELLLSQEERAFLAQRGPVTLCVDPDWMPFERINNIGQHEGIAADFVRLIGIRLGIEFKLVHTKNWEESKKKFFLGQCTALSAAAHSEAREKVMLFSQPYYQTYGAIAARDTELFIADFNLILDQPLGIVRGNYLVDRVRELNREALIIETENIQEGLQLLADKEIFAFLDTIPAIRYAAQQAGINGIKIAGQLEFSNHFHLTTLKGKERLIALFNKAIHTLTDQDKLTITARWANLKIDHQLDYKLLFKIILAFVLISLFLLYRHYSILRLNRVLKEANKKALQATLAKSEFLATMSHEIRTPMNAILGMSELLEETPLTAKQEIYVKTINRSGETLLALINDILDLSKIEAGQLLLDQTLFDLHRVMDEIIELFLYSAEEKGISLTWQWDDNLPSLVEGDANRLRQVLVNLIGNAIKFTEKGEVSLRVQEGKGDWIEFVVSDTGPGISKSIQEKIFQAFTQGDNSTTRRYGGSGLGLNICQRLAQLMKGTILLESKPGQGSSFIFSAPFKAGSPRHSPPTRTADLLPTPLESLESEKTESSGVTLLLVEDNQDNQWVIQAYLSHTTIHLVLAKNGLEAVEKFKAFAFDMVLMDIQMPIMDGLEATRQIRAWEQANNQKPTPILALTAHALKEESEKIQEAGCNLHLTKPIRKKKLLELIAQFVPQKPLVKQSEPTESIS
ncbi:MAG: transporter substrate-binding domain-containing protein [Magnetococcales bacterium]|nr:transporter substrate-binding domain-containing protein [Magnetococcales bacterium]